MRARTYLSNKYLYGALVLVLASVAQMAIMSSAHGLALTQIFVRFDRMQASTATTGTVCANPASTATEGLVQVTFPTGYTVSTTAGNWTTSTTNLAWPSGGTAWSVSSPSISGQTVTWTSPDLTVGTLYCFNWTNSAAVSTASSAANYTGTIATQTSGAAAIDSQTYTTAVVTSDQISLSATVPESFSFTLSSSSDTFSTPLSTGSVAVSPTPVTATINTNAKNGWMVWGYDQWAGIKSTAAAYTIGSTTPGTNSTIGAGSQGYNTGVTSSQTGGTGTITVAAPFVGGSTGKGGGLDTSSRTLASSNGTASGAVLTLTNNIAISSITPAAGDYKDTITVVAAATF